MLKTVLARFPDARRNGNGQYQARCPAHSDSTASLSITENRDGKVLVKCFAGCEYSRIREAAGLRHEDLNPPSEPAAANLVRREIAAYDYRDEAGELLYQVVRYEPKTFRQRRPDGNSGWVPTIRDVRQVPYRLPELLAAAQSLPVFIVEGEKDVETLRSRDFVATCNSGGAKNWTATHAEHLRGRDVILVPDNDDVGREHMRLVAQSLEGIARSVRLLDLSPLVPPKQDVSWFFEQGGAVDHFRTLVAAASNASPESKSLKNGTGTGRLVPVWKLPEPEPIRFVWGELIPENFATSLYGDGGQGKSFLALALGIHVATGRPFLGREVLQRPVVYLDAELNDSVFRERAFRVARGIGIEKPPEGLWYRSLRGSLTEESVVSECVAEIDALGEKPLVIIDSLTVAAYGADPNAANHIASLMKHIERFGTCLILDHIAKPPANGGQSSARQFGSVFKGNLVRSSIQVTKADGGDGILLRQVKTNFGKQAPPIGVAIGFSAEAVFLSQIELDDSRLSGMESQLSVRDRLKLRLNEGTARTSELADELQVPEKTIKNILSAMKKDRIADSDGKGAWFLC
jgi:hypothetical protein